jgi:outer membrane protein assembly factor BamB
MEADIHSGKWNKIFEVKGGDSLNQRLTPPVFYKTESGDDVLIMANSVIDERARATKGHVKPYLISYNRTQKKLNYEIQLDEPGLYSRVDGVPIIDGDKVYLLVESLMACHDIKTGKRIWERRFKADFLFSGAIIENGRIYANREGSDPTLYCVDANTGSIIWETPSAGTSSPLQYHDGVIYFVGGNTGLLHIVNAETGQHIYKITAPSQYTNPDDFFSAKCTVDRADDMLYVTSQTTAYCYPTIELN